MGKLDIDVIDVMIEEFKPYIKRHGFGYVHFINGGFLWDKEFLHLLMELYDSDKDKRVANIKDWYDNVEIG